MMLSISDVNKVGTVSSGVQAFARMLSELKERQEAFDGLFFDDVSLEESIKEIGDACHSIEMAIRHASDFISGLVCEANK